MKTVPIVLATLALVPALSQPVHACDKQRSSFSSDCCDSPARWASRHDTRDARFVINTEGGEASLLITNSVVAVQFSDKTINKVHRKFKEAENEDADNALGHAIKVAVLSSIRILLDHSAECPIRDIRDVDYHNGRLVITTDNGKSLFDDMDVSDEDVLGSFSEHDALAFVKEFRRAKGRLI
jgi:hypothetical protein